jgi:PEP-CTERM motif
MKKPVAPLLLTALVIWALPSTAAAAPVYNTGNECPTDAQLITFSFTRQYSAPDATACVYDAAETNIQGTTGEATTYLNAAAAQPTWGTGWVGLGQSVGPGIVGFSFTSSAVCPANTDCGTYTIGAPLTASFNQFALGIKDGANPQWAIFLLPVSDFSGNWSIAGGEDALSHFALYGHSVGGGGGGAGTPVIPEPATLILLGTGLGLAATRARNRNKRRT